VNKPSVSEEEWFKEFTGESEERYFAFPDWNETFNDIITQSKSRYPLRLLGIKQGGGNLTISEEQRPHAYFIGSTQEGKSKYFEHFIRGDITRGLGCCLLDPTTGGKTVYDVLRWCCYKKQKNVLLIDPHHRFDYGKIPALSPFLYDKDGRPFERLRLYSQEIILDTLRVLFNVSDPAETPRIERYLPSLLKILYNAQSPITDARFFSDRLFVSQRQDILSMTPELDPDRREIESAMNNPMHFEQYQSTVNRVARLYKNTLGLILHPTKGVDWMKMVAEKWTVLVNLDSGSGFDVLDSRLLGTLIINQIQTAIERLNKKGLYRPYYLYIDEAGEYANQKLARTMELKQKTGLKVTIGHQSSTQFKDKGIWERILNVSKLKAMFNLPGAVDRERISREFYGGDIDPKDAMYANADLPVQEAVVKPIKGKAVRVRTPTISEPPVTEEQLKQYIFNLYNENDWYHDANKLCEELNKVYEPKNDGRGQESVNQAATGNRATNDRKTNRKAGVPDRKDNGDKWKTISRNISVGKQHAKADGEKE